MFPDRLNYPIIRLMKRLTRLPRLIIFVFLLLILAVAFKVFFASPVFAPELHNELLGTGDNAAEHSTTFNLNNLPAIDDSKVTAKSYLIYDKNTDRLLAIRSPNASVAIASLTKLMTGYLVNKYGNMSDVALITTKQEFNVNPVLGLKAGDKVLVKDLFNSMIVGSANDAALTLGYYLQDKQRTSVQTLMNTEALKLGMNNTHFSNPIGFDSATNYSTAQDLKLLVQAISTYPTFKDLDRLQNYSFTNAEGKTFSVKATNKLLAGDPEIHAVKTGFTDQAGEAMITSIEHNGNNFIIIVLDGTNREQDTKLLKNEIIKAYYTSENNQ